MISQKNSLIKKFLDSLPYDKIFVEDLISTNNYIPIAINTLVAGGFYGDINDPNLQEFVDLIDGNGYSITTHRIEYPICYFRTKRV